MLSFSVATRVRASRVAVAGVKDSLLSIFCDFSATTMVPGISLFISIVLFLQRVSASLSDIRSNGAVVLSMQFDTDISVF